jgi:hypothetical protein
LRRDLFSARFDACMAEIICGFGVSETAMYR